MATIYRARADASRVKIRANLFCLLFSAFVSVWLATPNIWGKRRLERHDSGGSDTAQGTQNEQPVDKMWVSCARSGRSPRRFGAARCSDEMRARQRFRMPGDVQAKTLYVVFCQRGIYCVLQPARLDFDGAGKRDGLLLSAGPGAAMCQSCEAALTGRSFPRFFQVVRQAEHVNRCHLAMRWRYNAGRCLGRARGGSRVLEHPDCRR